MAAKYTSEQRKHAHCEVCNKDLGEKSKRAQWVRRLCSDCSETANDIAITNDIDFASGVERLKTSHRNGLKANNG